MGGQVRANTTVYSVTGSLQPASGKTITEFARRGKSVSHTFWSESELILETGDIMTDGNDTTYIVVWSGDEAGQGRVFAAHVIEKE